MHRPASCASTKSTVAPFDTSAVKLPPRFQGVSFDALFMRPHIEFAWRTGWRSGEVKNLPLSQLDFRAGVVRLEPGTTKS